MNWQTVGTVLILAAAYFVGYIVGVRKGVKAMAGAVQTITNAFLGDDDEK